MKGQAKNAIRLTDLIRIEDPSQYKLHLACTSTDGHHPLIEYVKSRNNWREWNEWRGERNDWTRPFIFSFMEFAPIEGAWLFGGIFQVKKRLRRGYEVADVREFTKYEGRLVCKFHRYQGLRGRAFKLETFINDFEVHNVLPERYSGEAFCGYDKINHRFDMLKAIIDSQRADWKASLSAVKGVYHIIDSRTGKVYVGSAYSDSGIWSRLHCYVNTGHGWNDDLVRVIKKKGLPYALKNFQFSILEVFTFNTPDKIIRDREAHWKNVMLSRDFGFNKN